MICNAPLLKALLTLAIPACGGLWAWCLIKSLESPKGTAWAVASGLIFVVGFLAIREIAHCPIC